MKFRWAILCLLFPALLVIRVYADEPPPPPYPYTIDLESGLTLYMTPPGEEDADHPASGVYRGDELVYSITDYTQERIIPANDGMSYLVVEWWVGSPESDAVSFYEQGTLARTYTALDLTKTSRMMQSVSHFQWDIQSERLHEPEQNTFRVTTRDGRMLTFDLTNGRIVTESRVVNYLHLGLGAAVGVASIVLVFFLRRRRQTS